MTKRIFRLTFLVSLFTAIAGTALIVGVLFNEFEKQITKELADEADYVSYAIESEGGKYLDNFSPEDSRITLISPDGTVIADTFADEKNMDNHSDREEFKEAMEKGSASSVRYSDTLTEKTVYYAKKMNDGNVIRVSATQYTIVAVILEMLRPIILVVFMSLLISFFLSKRAAKSIIKPINAIDPEHPESSDTYEELSPFLHKIINQNKIIAGQIEMAKQKQEEFRLITENMSEGFLIVDKSANLLSCNSSALRLLDAEKNSGSVLALNRTASFRETVQRALGGTRAEDTMQHEEKTYRLIANPVTEDGKTAGAVIVILDVTESAKREAMRREFTANVSHELKTPLTSISGFAELMKEGGMPEETVKDFSASIYSEAQRLITLVSDIIKISELDEKTISFDWEDVDLYALSEEIIQRYKNNKKNISFSLAGTHAYVSGVRRILEEIINNLCDNAVKYNKDNGEAEIVIEKEKGVIKLTVRDTGIGIPKSQQERIFERFYRIDKSRSKKEGGTGLGLSIVKHGAAYHDAEISVESEVGKGTAITVAFNAAE